MPSDRHPPAQEVRSRADLRFALAGNYPVIRRFLDRQCGRWLRIRESVSDLAQSVYREALSSLSRFRGGETDTGALRGYLFEIAKHKIANRRRYWNAERRGADRELRLEEIARSGGDAPWLGTSRTPERDAEHHEELAQVARVLADLPADYREVILLARTEGLSHLEIARRMERSEVAVRKLLSRALARVERELRDWAR